MTNTITKVFDIMKTSGFPVSTRYSGEFGVEIETETERKYEYPTMKFWEAKKDNSLRDWGVEYVLKVPMDLPDLEKALSEFAICEKKYKFKNGSVSTSVHVHVNMLNETYLTVANFLAAYALVENVLVRYSGPDRLSNLFCLPICDAEGILDKWLDILGKIGRNMFAKAKVAPEYVKYSGCNIATLGTLGTLEIRTFRGETDIKIIQKWIEIIQKIRLFASQEGMTPVRILELWKENKDTILDIIFQEFAEELRTKDTDQLIRKNVLYVAKLANSSKDWTKFGVLKVKPVYKEKIKDDLDNISQSRFKVPFDQLQYHERLAVHEEYHRLRPNDRIVELLEDI